MINTNKKIKDNERIYTKQDMINLAINIVDELYFGYCDNPKIDIIVLGEGKCLQELCHGGASMLKHKYLVKGIENFIKHFNKVAYKYTNGERGSKT